MVATPEATPVTTPDAFTVATPRLDELQVPPVPVVVSVVVNPVQIAFVPEITPAFGAAVTVTVLVAVAFAQPPVPVTV